MQKIKGKRIRVWIIKKIKVYTTGVAARAIPMTAKKTAKTATFIVILLLIIKQK